MRLLLPFRCVVTLAAWLLPGLMFGADDPNPMVLWYGQPAKQWTDALPVGNGRLGAMVSATASCKAAARTRACWRMSSVCRWRPKVRTWSMSGSMSVRAMRRPRFAASEARRDSRSSRNY